MAQAGIIVPIVTTVISTVLSIVLASASKVTSDGSRLDDLGAPTAEYGYNLAQAYGRCTIESCSMIWAEPLYEKTSRSGGKGLGGGGGKTYSYYLTAAFEIGLEVESIEKIYMNGEMVWDKQNLSNEKSQTFSECSEIFLGSFNQSPSSIIESYEGFGNVPAFRGRSYFVVDRLPVEIYEGTGFPKVDVEVVGKLGIYPKVADIIEDLCLSAGLTQNDIDTSDIQGYHIEGIIMRNDGTSFRKIIEELQQIFLILTREAKGKLYFYQQQRSSVTKTIPLESLASRTFGSNTIAPYNNKRTHYRELPSEVQIDFINYFDAFKDDNVKIINPVAKHNNHLNIKSAIIDNRSTMATAANHLLYQSNFQRNQYTKLFLLPAYNGLKLGDLIIVDGEILQITKKTFGNNYIIELEASLYYDFDFNVTITETQNNPTIQPLGEAEIIPLDIPLIRDTDEDFGIYIAVIGNEDWTNGSLYISDDNGLTYNYAIPLLSVSTVGSITGIVPDTSSSFIDTETSITVTLESGEGVDPVTDDEFLSAAQVGLFGKEMILFRDVTLISNNPKVYQFSHLIRGYRGTEYWIDKHTTNERFILLTGYRERLTGSLSDIGITYRFKAVPTSGIETYYTDYSSLTIEGESIKPYTPVQIEGIKSGNNWILTWIRRTRKYNDLMDYVDIGLAPGELDEYFILIYNSSGNLVNTYSSIYEEFMYLESEQIADFGSVQTTLRVKVLQKSSYPVDLQRSDIVLLT